jgi:hypothetical protein
VLGDDLEAGQLEQQAHLAAGRPPQRQPFGLLSEHLARWRELSRRPIRFHELLDRRRISAGDLPGHAVPGLRMRELSAARREGRAGGDEVEQRVEQVEDQPAVRLQVRPEGPQRCALRVGRQRELEDS